jgi:pimeloyl-ACP methyl ester carboxylesterase
MPLVFIHGVNNRIRPGYQEATAARDALFRKFALAALCQAPDAATICNPFWGGQGAIFRWGLACLPLDDDSESLGPDADTEMEPLAASTLARAGTEAPTSRILVTAAQADFPGTVDDMLAAGAVEADTDTASFAEGAVRAAAYADAHPQPPSWVLGIRSDEEFLDRLLAEIEGAAPSVPGTPPETDPVEEYETLGGGDLWGAVRDGVDRLRVAAADRAGGGAYGLVRRHVAPNVATFFGDVLEYLAHRGDPAEPGTIVEIIAADLRQAIEAVTDDDPYLIVVGHSLGGVIAYDLLTSFLPNTRVHALVTVGSQVGLFEELKLFLGSDPAVPTGGARKLVRPANLEHWVNVFDINDVLSYRLTEIVDGVDEFRYATGKLLTAHGAYFGQPRFHQRLAERLRALLVP